MLKSKQQGVALLMAMMVVTVASAFAVSLVHDQTINVRKTGNIQQNEMSLMYALGLEDYARLILQKDARDSKVDNLEEDWAIGIPALPIEGGYLSGALQDAQSLINLNGMTQTINQQRLRALCKQLDVSDDFIPALVDWIDADVDLVNGEGAEDDYYTSLEIPYRAANRPMTDISELLLVKGMTYENHHKLLPFVTVLPGDTALNLNTISKQVYLSIDNDLDGDKFIESREDEPFASLQDYQSRMNHTLPQTGLSVSSDYFLASGQVSLGEKLLSIHSLFYRGNNGETRILNRRLGDF